MKKGIIVLVMLIVVVSGAYFYQQQRFVKKASEKIQTQKSFPIEELTYEEDQKIGGNTGKVLAGSKSVYKEFHQTD